MALDVFHQVLARLHELAGGNPRQLVSLVDVLRQEKLFGSADLITSKLHSAGWIADSSRQDHVYVTIWGIEEVRRAAGDASPAAAEAPAAARAPGAPEPKNAAALRAAAAKVRELAATLEELATGAGGTAAQRKAKAKKALAAASEAFGEAFE